MFFSHYKLYIGIYTGDGFDHGVYLARHNYLSFFYWEKTRFMYFNIVPLDENSCRMEWLISNDLFDDPEKLNGQNKIIHEDIEILELIQCSYNDEGSNFEKSVESDATMLTLRKIVKFAEKKSTPSDWDLPERQIITIMAPAIPGVNSQDG